MRDAIPSVLQWCGRCSCGHSQVVSIDESTLPFPPPLLPSPLLLLLVLLLLPPPLLLLQIAAVAPLCTHRSSDLLSHANSRVHLAHIN